jgi:hypothetical protein
MNNEDINITIEDPNVIYEMEWFERKMPSKKMIFQAVGMKHDDYIMALVWGLYVLHPDIIEDYYNIVSYATNKYGLPYINKIASYNSGYYSDGADSFKVDIDKIFNNISTGNTEALTTNRELTIEDDNTPRNLVFSNMDSPSPPPLSYQNTESNPYDDTSDLFM